MHKTSFWNTFITHAHSQKIGKQNSLLYVIRFFLFFVLFLDFSHSSFPSDPAGGKKCVTSSCTSDGNNLHVIFVKAYFNSTDSGVRGLCGKYCYID